MCLCRSLSVCRLCSQAPQALWSCMTSRALMSSTPSVATRTPAWASCSSAFLSLRSRVVSELLSMIDVVCIVCLCVCLYGRLKEKDLEWRRARREHSRRWNDELSKNFTRALDHRSFAFKHNERKALLPKCTPRSHAQPPHARSLY